ncbi:MAG TPA: FliG C-terminal domain-containing protein [Rectinemataceae bacterium]|nr:FliG C-terminal domain-containing protein [Rectinemataceae bacterium]
MIRALAGRAAARWEPQRASRQKRDALFELATRIAAIAERSRAFEREALAEAALVESRKILRTGLELASAGAEIEAIEASFAANPAFSRADPGDALELCVTLTGLRGLLAREHPYAIMRRMSARLGIEYFDKTEAWILSRLGRRRARSEPLIVPGELPDVIRALALDPRSLELSLRTAGRELAAAALAGCPQESIDLAKPFFGRIGAAIIEDDVAHLRSRLSGDEISEAQAAFAEVVRTLAERGRLKLGEETDFIAPPAFVAALTKAVIALDDRVLKVGLRGLDGAVLAMAMQGMEPGAHDRILGVLAKRDERRLLDAIDDAAPLESRAIQEAGRELAAKLLAAAKAADRSKAASASPEALDRLTLVKDWEG